MRPKNTPLQGSDGFVCRYFLFKWGDVGQITAATFAARFGFPLIVWAGAVGAMVTKGVRHVSAGIRKWISQRIPKGRSLFRCRYTAAIGLTVSSGNPDARLKRDDAQHSSAVFEIAQEHIPHLVIVTATSLIDND